MSSLRAPEPCPDCGSLLVSEAGILGLCPQCLLGLGLAMSPAEKHPPAEAHTLDRPPPGRLLGDRYQVRELLGQGGMGEVCRAFDLKLRVDVALKAVRPGRVEDERGREMLRREVRAAREVVSPNVCRIFDLVDEGGEELVSMEYIDGQTLAAILAERGPLELQEAREIAAQFLSGLEAIHLAGLVHRDFKPENVMVTRAGRVVVMDFGVAKSREESTHGTVSGTPAYMPPEQARGEAVDARADVYAAGLVLAEMVSVESAGAHEARQALWRAVRETPPRVPEGPWASVLRRALDPRPEERPASARALSRALEEVTERLPGFEAKRPYPGLSSFTEADAEYFFGREVETEAVWKKLKRPRLLGLVGPSGAGKTSFLRAGLLPTLPPTWRAVLTTPGTRPLQALARALAPHLIGDPQAVEDLPRFDDLDVLVGLVSRWRKRHAQALVIVDQFEELFTQSPKQLQTAYAELLGRLVLEADAHVVVSLRDDFLIHCHGHEALAPILSDLTLLGPLSESGLRRALVQPALKCGYRFEADELVEEMVHAVRGERGAMPLLAFAAARLWDLREREGGLLTREAYRRIGGVAGALAQHAEATLDRIGAARAPLVRELFRNLVTAQGTRLVRDRKELLSVFEGKEAQGAGEAGEPAVDSAATPVSRESGAEAKWTRQSAEQVLNALVDARLLTAYDRPGDAGESGPQVEIVHESLLRAWPRLVRWQTQDADGALLRDQLRQAAQLWHDRDRPQDLLWTGSAYRDLALWRERYPGGLSATEQAFAHAAARLSGRRRRRRRLALAVGLATAVFVTAGALGLWRRSEGARRTAEAEVRQREAAQLVSLGRLQLAEFPTAALAHAVASLERADNASARRFAVEVLWKGPPARYVSASARARRMAFSPDGHWLAGAFRGGVQLWTRDGGAALLIPHDDRIPGFSADGQRLVTCAADCDTLRVRSLPAGNLMREISLGWPVSQVLFPADGNPIAVSAPRSGRLSLRTGPLDEGGWVELSPLDVRDLRAWAVDRSGHELVALGADGSLLLHSLDDPARRPRLVGRHDAAVHVRVAGARAVTSTAAGDVSLFQLDGDDRARRRALPTPPNDAARVASGLENARAWLDPSSQAALFLTPNHARYWALDDPPETEASTLSDRLESAIFAPQPAFTERWVALARLDYGVFWPLRFKRSRVLRVPGPPSFTSLVFNPDGRFLFSHAAFSEVRAWPLSPEAGRTSLTVYRAPNLSGFDIDRDPGGRFVVASRVGEGVAIVPLDGGAPRILEGQKGDVYYSHVRLDRAGRRLAFYADDLDAAQSAHLHVRDLETGQGRAFDTRAIDACARGTRMQGLQWSVGFLPDGTPFSDGFAGLRVYDVSSGTSRALRPCDPRSYPGDQNAWHGFTLSPDGRLGIRVLAWRDGTARSIVTVVDLAGGQDREITSHGSRVFNRAALDPTGRILVTGDKDGLVRVGPVTGEEPHLLYGHTAEVTGLAVSPDGQWIASAAMDGTIRLWPMPDGPPLHTRPHAELLAKLRALTNLRVQPDAGSATGYKLVIDPFPGWASVPEW